MPTYVFKCSDCDTEVEKVLPMSQSQLGPTCQQCGTSMQRNYASEHAHASADSYATPIHSDALAISPDQVEEHRRMFPDIELDSECRPVFTKYSTHDAYLEKAGFVKHPNKHGKRRSTTL